MKRIAGVSLPTFVAARRDEAESALSAEIVELLRQEPDAVLGLATGNSPTGVYRELRAAHAEGRVSFERATTFNLDEYLGLGVGAHGSFRRTMEEQFLSFVRPSAAYLPELEHPTDDPRAVAEAYERALHAQGGLDLVILGLGQNGHIGFNEPGSSRESRTRVVELHPTTRAGAVRAFGSLAAVPTHAITMGIATILEARAIRVLAFGADKAEIVRRTLQDEIGPTWPATYLRLHPDVRLYVDEEAARDVVTRSATGRS